MTPRQCGPALLRRSQRAVPLRLNRRSTEFWFIGEPSGSLEPLGVGLHRGGRCRFFESPRHRFILDREAAGRGVKLVWESYWEFTAEPDYTWIIRESIADVADPAKQLQGIAAKTTEGTDRDLIRIIASFVQTLPCQIPATRRTLPNGDRLCTFGIALPIEVLFLKWGDCDSKCLLFASILANFPNKSVVFFHGGNHLFAGVQMAPRSGDRHVSVQGIPYVLVELSTPRPASRVHRQLWTRTKRGLYEIIPAVHPDLS